MIVTGLDVHRQSVIAVAVDEAGRPLSEKVIPVGSDELLDWAGALDAVWLWAVEDCRRSPAPLLLTALGHPRKIHSCRLRRPVVVSNV